MCDFINKLKKLEELKTKNELIELLLQLYNDSEYHTIMEYSSEIDSDLDELNEFISKAKTKVNFLT